MAFVAFQLFFPAMTRLLAGPEETREDRDEETPDHPRLSGFELAATWGRAA